MKKQAVIMGMPVTIDVSDKNATDEDINEVFAYFHYIDNTFSTFKKDSEISQINRGEIKEKDFSGEVKKIFRLSENTKTETYGYFDISLNGKIDPSGIVKGYAISGGAKILIKKGFHNFFVEIAGDIQANGKNSKNNKWSLGIQNPFNTKEIIKVVYLSDKGIASSGNYQRGEHIYNPISKKSAKEVAGITVIANDIFDADRFATAAFAMGKNGINFLESLKNVEGYMVTKAKMAIMTSGFEKYTIN
jgi:FAD:protein FMN transferase